MSGDRHLRVGAFIDGELAAAEAAQVEGHLAGCEQCRRAVAEARALSAALPEPLPALPPDFTARTRARALARRLPEAPLWWLAVPAPWRLGLAALLVLAAVAGARLGETVATDRTAATELAAALEAPATQALLAAPPAAPQVPEVRR